MRIPILMIRLESALFHDLIKVVIHLFFWNDIVLADGFTYDLRNRKTGRKTGIRILENHLDFGAEQTELISRKIVNLDSVEENLPGRFIFEPEDRLSYCGLSASGFSDKTHCGSALNVERNSIHGTDISGYS